MKDEIKTAIVTAVLMIGLIIIFKNVIYKPLNVVPLYFVPVFLYIGYITRRFGAKCWIGWTLFLTLAMAVLYAFF